MALNQFFLCWKGRISFLHISFFFVTYFQWYYKAIHNGSDLYGDLKHGTIINPLVWTILSSSLMQKNNDLLSNCIFLFILFDEKIAFTISFKSHTVKRKGRLENIIRSYPTRLQKYCQAYKKDILSRAIYIWSENEIG